VLVVYGDRVVDLLLFDGSSDVVDALLEWELRRMDADYHQSLVFVFLGPGTDIGSRAQPVDTGISPEIDEDDLTAQGRCRQGRRIQPIVRKGERSQFGLTADLAGMVQYLCYRLLLRHFRTPDEAGNRRPDCDDEDDGCHEFTGAHR